MKGLALARQLAIVVVVATLFAGCDGGSKTFGVNYYNVSFTVVQDPSGAVSLIGDTDLPDNTVMEGIIATSADPARAQETAMLSGSTRSPGSQPVKKAPGQEHATFKLVIANALTATCNHQPPCGGFPAGAYHLILDARTPHDDTAEFTTYKDPRFRERTNGFTGFAGVEIVKPVQLKKIQLMVDADGHQVNPLTQVPTASPSPTQ